MNINQPAQQVPIIQDENENKLTDSSTADTSTESVSTDASTNISQESPADTVSTNLDSNEYNEDFQSEDQSVQSEIEGNQSQNKPVIEQETEQSDIATPEVNPKSDVKPTETPPINVNIPVKKDITKAESKTQKHYENIIKKANNIRRKFTKKQKTMSTWDDNKKHEWRTNISDTLISIIRQAKNKHTLKIHHKQLKSMRNLFNHYLNKLSTSNQSRKSKTEKISKK
jgi:hypothetical protein